jgi:ABC-type transport system involved in cytochrome c biogenesis ATPase subunit
MSNAEAKSFSSDPAASSEAATARPIQDVRAALRKFADMIASDWLFDEASVALDAGDDYKLTITCTENAKGYVVALHRHQSLRLGTHSFIKLDLEAA